MLQYPPLPTWDSLHPLVVHFPIALLLVCPLFILIGAMLSAPKGRPYLISAFLLLVLGTGSLFVSARTGEAGSKAADRDPSIRVQLIAHRALAQETRDIFVTLCILAAGMALLSRLEAAQRPAIAKILPLSFLAFYAVGVIFLVNTADRGGRLVHELGVHAEIEASTEQPAAAHDARVPD